MENKQKFLQSLKKQQADFETVKNIVESQFALNGRTDETGFEPALVLFMLQKLKQTAASHIIACEAFIDDDETLSNDYSAEKAEWEKLSKALSGMDKAETTLADAMRSTYNRLASEDI